MANIRQVTMVYEEDYAAYLCISYLSELKFYVSEEMVVSKFSKLVNLMLLNLQKRTV